MGWMHLELLKEEQQKEGESGKEEGKDKNSSMSITI